MKRLGLLIAIALLAACQGNNDDGNAAGDAVPGDDSKPGSVALWMPAGAEAAFMSSRGGNTEIYLTRGTGGGEWINLSESEGGDNWPVWSPDGSRIAFQSSREDMLDIYVMNADGTGVTRLTDHPEHDYLPAWSPDGSQLTFASWRREPGDSAQANHIYIMNADGSDQRRLFAWSPETSTSAVWSPDAKTFVLARRFGTQPADIVIVARDGTLVRRLTNDDAVNGAPVFSPGGDRVAFHSERGERSEIVVVDVDGADRRPVVTGARSWYPNWSPDGRYLIYTAAAGGEADSDLDVMAIPVDGGEPVVIAGGPDRESEGRWRPLR